MADAGDTSETPPPENDGTRWLALLILSACMVLVKGIRRRYGLSDGAECPRCHWKF